MADVTRMSQERLRMQLRVVQTVYRAETKRLDRIPDLAERDDQVRDLRSRSMAILDEVRAALDGSAPWHDELSAVVRAVEADLRAGEPDGNP